MGSSWTQGADYGEFSVMKYLLDPVYFITGKSTSEVVSSAASSAGEAVKSGFTNAVNAANAGYQAYNKNQADIAAAAAAAEAARKKAEEEAAAAHARNMAIGAACTLAVGIGGFIAYKHYKKTGHILPEFGAKPAHV